MRSLEQSESQRQEVAGLTARRGGEEAWRASAVWVQSFSFAMNRVLLKAGGDGGTPA